MVYHRRVKTQVAEVEVGGVARAVTIDEEARRIEIDIPSAGTAVMEFRLAGTRLSMLHTEVPEALRGQGIGDALAAAALSHARSRGWTVKPYCPFLSGYIDRHPEYGGLVDPSFTRRGNE